MNNKGLIPLSALIVGSTITFASLNKYDKFPSTEQWLGLMVAYTGISLASDVGFKPAGGFAALLMVTVFVSRGTEAIEYLSPKTTGKKVKKTRKRQQGNPTVISETERYG